jgi:hypothetical protein
MAMVMMMMPARSPVMMMVMHERQVGAGSDRGLLHDRCRGCRNGEAYRRDCRDNNVPDAHKFLP